MNRLFLLPLLFSAATLAASPIQFTFGYGDAPGTGFKDPVLGPARKAALAAAASRWGSLLSASYPGETIRIQTRFTDLGGAPAGSTTIPLAASHPWDYNLNFSSPAAKFLPNTLYPSALANHLHRSDLTGIFLEEIVIDFNLRVDTDFPNEHFYYGTDGLSDHGNFDFMTVAMHEIAHGLGIATLLQFDGNEFLDAGPPIYDRFLFHKSANQFVLDETQSTRAADITSDDVYFSTSTLGLVKLAATPDVGTFSYLGHLDQPTYPDDLMNPTHHGPAHTPSPYDLAILSDMGWDLAVPIPEPAALFTLVPLLGLVCLHVKHKNR